MASLPELKITTFSRFAGTPAARPTRTEAMWYWLPAAVDVEIATDPGSFFNCAIRSAPVLSGESALTANTMASLNRIEIGLKSDQLCWPLPLM